MNTIHIFGDSFSDDVENNFFLPKGNETDFRWYNAIRQNYYLINHIMYSYVLIAYQELDIIYYFHS